MPFSDITIEDYTEKSFVVRGETQRYKESLKVVGGKWNSRLTDLTSGEIFGAWIFPSIKKDDVTKWIKNGTHLVNNEAPVYEGTRLTTSRVSVSGDHQILEELKKTNNKLDRLEKMIIKQLIVNGNKPGGNSSDSDEDTPHTHPRFLK